MPKGQELLDCAEKRFANPQLAPWAYDQEAFPVILTGPDGSGGFEILCDSDGNILYQIGP